MAIHTTWAEIDLGAIAHNVGEVRRVVGPGTRIMAVVKANAYGHGAAQVAQVALESGAEFLGVARVQEGVELRVAGIRAPILVFGYTPSEFAGELAEHQLTQTVYSRALAEALAEAARAAGKTLRVHLKIDTGMGRLGIVSGTAAEVGGPGERAVREAAAIAALRGLELEGIYTHFAASDSSNKESARGQLTRFLGFLDRLARLGVEVPIRHAANSGAVIDMPETHLDMVRPGIMLYGLYPSEDVDHARALLKPAMQVKARVAQVKEVPASFKVSYASTYETPHPTRIATVAVGYADGYNRHLSSRGTMLVRGVRAPVVGRVTMDQTMIDVGHIEGVSPGDEVVVFGEQGRESLPVEEVARTLGTINYEVVSNIAARVPRVYVGGPASLHQS